MSSTLEAVASHPGVVALADAFAAANIPLFAVGGCVRDALMGRDPSDIDLTTPADVDTIRMVSSRAGSTFELGTEFGTIGVVVDGETFEITQHRAETYDDQSRKPTVVGVDDIVADLARRDFTINAMAIRLGQSPELIDPFDGAADLAEGILRCPSDPDQIFFEDPLRILRLVRFAARFDFAVETATAAAARNQAHRLSIVSSERVTGELLKLVAGGPVAAAQSAGVARRVGAAGRLFGTDDIDGLPTLVTTAGIESSDSVLAAIGVGVGPDVLFAQHRFTNDTMAQVRAVASVVAELVSMAGDDRVSLPDVRATLRANGNDVCRTAAALAAAQGAERAATVMLLEVQARPGFATASLPVNGGDVLASGLKPGPEVGAVLRAVEREFCLNPDLDRADALELVGQLVS